jgi:deoxyribonuclease-4
VFERGASVGCTALQIFTKSNRQWFEKDIPDEEIMLFKQAHKESDIKAVVVHAGYLINIGSGKESTAKLSTNALLGEVHRCQGLGLPTLILHPGAHVGSGVDVSIKHIAARLDDVFERSDGTVAIALETMAGQGTSVGSTFEQLAQIRALCHHKKHVTFCLDTCHVFAAGYDITSEDGFTKMLKNFDDVVGLEHLSAIHVNDSQGVLASHVDRHAALGKGHIPLETFASMMNDRRLTHVPKILETPSDAAMKLWAKEIALLKEMAD